MACISAWLTINLTASGPTDAPEDYKVNGLDYTREGSTDLQLHTKGVI